MTEESTGKTRINKYLAEQGLASRREADELIAAGRVLVNGNRAVLGTLVSRADKIKIVQSKTAGQKYIYILYHKPKGVVTTTPRKGEKEILDIVKFPTKVFPVGRIDKDSEGLMLFTNDRRITGRILEPQHEHEKEYYVEVDKKLTSEMLSGMERGVRIEDGLTKPCNIERVGGNSFTIILTEGKNRQIRKMCAVFGYTVTRLIRVRIMHLLLGKLEPNMFRTLKNEEQKMLLREIGLG